MGLVTMWWERYHQGTQGELFSCGPVERLLMASHAVWFYLGKLVWPVNLTFSYPRWTINAADPLAYGWLVAGLGLGVVIYFARRLAGRGVEVAALFYVATLSPMLGFIMLYTFRYSFVADHYQYAASIGPIALAAAGMTRACVFSRRENPFQSRRWAGRCCWCGLLTWRQCGMYADIGTLWRVTMAKNPNSWLAHNNLGKELLRTGQVDDAIVHFQQAVKIEPQYPSAQINLGIALFQKGQVDQAIAQFQKILEMEIGPKVVGVHYLLATALLQKGRVDEAIIQYQKALEIHPEFAKARYDLAAALFQKGRVDEAIIQYQRVLEMKPGDAATHNNLGDLLLQKGQEDEAITRFEKTLELQIQPDAAEVHNNLGNALLQKGRVDEAITQCQMALEIKPDHADAQINLGIALFKKGRVGGPLLASKRPWKSVLATRKPVIISPTWPGCWRPVRKRPSETEPGPSRWLNKWSGFPRAVIHWCSRRWRRLMPRRGAFPKPSSRRNGRSSWRLNKAMPRRRMFWAGKSSCIKPARLTATPTCISPQLHRSDLNGHEYDEYFQPVCPGFARFSVTDSVPPEIFRHQSPPRSPRRPP